MMENVHPIRTEKDYDWAIAEVTRYFEEEPAPGTPDAERFMLLTDLIEAYEEKHYPIKAPDPVSLIADYLQRTGKKQNDLASIIGSKSRASEIMTRKRALNVGQIHAIAQALASIIGSKSRASEIMTRKRALNVGQIHAIAQAWKLPAEELVRPYHLDGEEPTKT